LDDELLLLLEDPLGAVLPDPLPVLAQPATKALNITNAEPPKTKRFISFP
jgi:hypothetical protein